MYSKIRYQPLQETKTSSELNILIDGNKTFKPQNGFLTPEQEGCLDGVY